MNGPFGRHSKVTDAAGCDWPLHGGRMERHSTLEMHRASLQRSPGPIGWQRFAHHRLMICWPHEMSDNACHGRW
jgi:hypothetical protein